MKQSLSFDDVLIAPMFSDVLSRKDVDTTSSLMGLKLPIGVISSNMDSVTEVEMCKAMSSAGGIGCLHRFMDIPKNAYMFEQLSQAGVPAMASVGVGGNELERFDALLKSGASLFVLDVANGANMNVVEQVQKMRELGGSKFQLMVGNFATGRSINAFLHHLGDYHVDALKIGVGGGSACITRQVSGCGMPTFGSILDCRQHTNIPLIADGGIRNSGDFAKALAAGAKAVMVGGMLAGCTESSAEPVYGEAQETELRSRKPIINKRYRGSASAESYAVQGKVAQHRAPEGESFLVPYAGPVSGVIQKLEGGLRGAMSTVGARNLEQFRDTVEFIQVTPNGTRENGAHGKKT